MTGRHRFTGGLPGGIGTYRSVHRAGRHRAGAAAATDHRDATVGAVAGRLGVTA